MTEVTTRGSGEVRHRADRATLSIKYTAKAADRTRAVEGLTAKVGPVEQLLDRPGLRVRSRDLSVHDTWSGRRRSGAEADQWYELRVADLDLLPDLVGAIVGSEPAYLSGPDWELKDRSGAVREAQHLAVMDARERAEGYAIALGARLGRLVKLEDEPAPGVFADGAVAYAGGPPAGGRQVDVSALELEPELVRVHVACKAVWELVS